VSTGLLIIRLLVGLLLVGHGTQKLFGWFDGPGIQKTARGFEGLGYRPAVPMAIVAGFGEAASGASIAAGLLFPIGAAALVGVMINAGAVHWPNGLWITNKGYEFTLLLGGIAAGLAFTGPGRFSLDHAIGLDLDGIAWGIGATAAGLVAGGLTQLLRVRNLRQRAGARVLS
jgi:putative oxidoreductase